jgi:hypothetical protein
MGDSAKDDQDGNGGEDSDQTSQDGPQAAPSAAGSGRGGGPVPPQNGEIEILPVPNEDSDVLVTDKIRQEVGDAVELAEHVVKNAVRRPDGRSVAPDFIKVIKVTAGKIKLFEYPERKPYEEGEPKPHKDPDREQIFIKASDWTRFELAYYALAEFSAPVTVETLRNTQSTGAGFRDISPAQAFTRWLWGITALFAFVVLAGGAISTGADNSTPRIWAGNLVALNYYIPIIVPWAYGGLGACAFLLRTAHNLIAERAFDIRRKPEYGNRILLGMVSGGTIVLLFNPATDDDTLKISAAALGFVAGYSNDLLFNAVERITAAILPKVGLETLSRDSVPRRAPLELQTGGMTLKELMDRMENAKPEDKEFYKSLLTKLGDRL